MAKVVGVGVVSIFPTMGRWLVRFYFEGFETIEFSGTRSAVSVHDVLLEDDKLNLYIMQNFEFKESNENWKILSLRFWYSVPYSFTQNITIDQRRATRNGTKC